MNFPFVCSVIKSLTESSWSHNVSGKKIITLLAGVFVISRILFLYTGVRFDSHPLDGSWQYLDPALLRNDLLNSVYYLHSQPPLFNLFLGLAIKMSAGYESMTFAVIYTMLGLLLSLSMFLIMVRLGVNEKLSFALTVLFMISPSAILYENGLFYTYPVTCLLCLATISIHRLAERATYVDALIFFLLLAVLVLVRSVFHIVWFAFFFVVLLIGKRANWKKVVVGFLVPFSVVLLCYGKNLYLFGMFSTSSWLGMSLAYNTTEKLPVDTVKSLVKKNILSNLSQIEPFSPVSLYLPYLPPVHETGIPALDNQFKSTGAINYNHIAYLEASKVYLKDSCTVIRYFPITYLVSVVGAFRVFMIPSNEYHKLRVNRDHIELLESIYNPLFYGQLPSVRGQPLGVFPKESLGKAIWHRIEQVGFFIVLMYFVAILYGLKLIYKMARQRPLDLPFVLTVSFVWLNIVYVSLVVNFIANTGENNRFRFMIDPLIVIIVGLFLQDKLPAFFRRWEKPNITLGNIIDIERHDKGTKNKFQ